MQISCINITSLSHCAHIKLNLGVACSDHEGITFNMCRKEISKAPPGGHLSSVENKAIEQNFSVICHLEIDHPGIGS